MAGPHDSFQGWEIFKVKSQGPQGARCGRVWDLLESRETPVLVYDPMTLAGGMTASTQTVLELPHRAGHAELTPSGSRGETGISHTPQLGTPDRPCHPLSLFHKQGVQGPAPPKRCSQPFWNSLRRRSLWPQPPPGVCELGGEGGISTTLPGSKFGQ